MSWSSGKDAAFALHQVRREGRFEVVGLLTTVTDSFQRVSMHGVREVLLEAQAASLGLPLHKVAIPYPCPNDVYEHAMQGAVEAMRAEGVTRLVFGDLFLDEVRTYRIQRLAGTGIEPVFPLWGRPTRALAEEMIAGGLEARIVCLDPKRVPRAFSGRAFDRRLLRDLPHGVDPCGERGEFHTFVTAGPMFPRPIPVVEGASVERDGFVFTDLRPAERARPTRFPGGPGRPGRPR